MERAFQKFDEKTYYRMGKQLSKVVDVIPQ